MVVAFVLIPDPIKWTGFVSCQDKANIFPYEPKDVVANLKVPLSICSFLVILIQDGKPILLVKTVPTPFKPIDRSLIKLCNEE